MRAASFRKRLMVARATPSDGQNQNRELDLGKKKQESKDRGMLRNVISKCK
jgi:hypothetical protein